MPSPVVAVPGPVGPVRVVRGRLVVAPVAPPVLPVPPPVVVPVPPPVAAAPSPRWRAVAVVAAVVHVVAAAVVHVVHVVHVGFSAVRALPCRSNTTPAALVLPVDGPPLASLPRRFCARAFVSPTRLPPVPSPSRLAPRPPRPTNRNIFVSRS